MQDFQPFGPFAHVLLKLGTRRAFVVHGHDGLDEISVCAATRVSELREGDYEQHEALLGDTPLDLTPTEFDILSVLVERAPAVLSPQEIARRVFDYNVSEVEARELVRWHIHHLRRKLEIDPDQPHMLKNVRGVGYKLDIA